jgi:hypothetical protein
VLGPVNRGHERDVLRPQSPYLHESLLGPRGELQELVRRAS